MGLKKPLVAALSAANTFSATIYLEGSFNLSIWGTFLATVTIQRSFDGGTTWLDITTYTAPTEQTDTEPEGALYRAGIKAGQYTSGTVNVRMGQ